MHDPAGNLTDATWPGTDATRPAEGPRSYTGTQLTTAGRVRYEYDTAGRMTLRQVTRLSRKPDTWRFTWNAEDRLTHVTTPDGTVWRYLYDPLGRRVAKHRLADDGHTVVERTDFTWDGPQLAEQTTHAPYLPGPHTLSWDHDGLHPLAQTETIATPLPDHPDQDQIDRRFFAIVTDLVGSPTELLDPADATVAWRATSTLWGTTTWPATSTTYTPLRFPGQYFDPETRLHYNLNRYYDPETARYLSPDPLGLSPHQENGQAKRGRAEDLQPDENAEGSHTVFELDENGRVARYQTWIHEPRARDGWMKGPRFRGTGKPHSGVNPPLYYPKGGGLGVSATDENLPRGS